MATIFGYQIPQRFNLVNQARNVVPFARRVVKQQVSPVISRGVQRVQQTPKREFFLPTSTPIRRTVQPLIRRPQKYIQPRIQRTIQAVRTQPSQFLFPPARTLVQNTRTAGQEFTRGFFNPSQSRPRTTFAEAAGQYIGGPSAGPLGLVGGAGLALGGLKNVRNVKNITQIPQKTGRLGGLLSKEIRLPFDKSRIVGQTKTIVPKIS